MKNPIIESIKWLLKLERDQDIKNPKYVVLEGKPIAMDPVIMKMYEIVNGQRINNFTLNWIMGLHLQDMQEKETIQNSKPEDFKENID